MRCYFHLVDAHEVLLDEDGVEVANLQEAVAAVKEMRTEPPWRAPSGRAGSWK